MPTTAAQHVVRKSIALTVNGQTVRAEVEPRLQLADFLREHLSLTGTHLGCEHGVCGACTIEIDGAPARSCIAYAAACDGVQVRTIEGYDGDEVMTLLRTAFSTEHALQCGYCTPGMLVTARDIVLRLPDADEARIRKELAGNLCRCTGYVGIVRAIQRVMTARGSARGADLSAPAAAPAGGTLPATGERREVGYPSRGPAAQVPAAGSAPSRSAAPPADATPPQSVLHHSFTVDHPRDRVWAFFGRLGEVTPCLPGASVLGEPTEDHVELSLRVKVGPIAPEFRGAADVTRDPATHSGTIRARAADTRSSSATRGEIRYALFAENEGAATRVEVDLGYTLTGPLAQFGRSGIVQDIARRMTSAFASNVEARLERPDDAGAPTGAVAPRTVDLDAGSLFFSALRGRLRALLRSVFRR